MLRILLACMLTTGALAATASSGTTKNTGWTTFVGKDFTIQYPKEWSLDQSGAMGTIFFLSAPKLTHGEEFVNTINLVIREIDDPKLTLESYNNQTIAALNKELPLANIISSKTVAAKVPYRELHFSGVQIKVRLEWYQFFFIKNKRTYTLTFTAEQSSYQRLFPVASAIMHSFAITK